MIVLKEFQDDAGRTQTERLQAALDRAARENEPIQLDEEPWHVGNVVIRGPVTVLGVRNTSRIVFNSPDFGRFSGAMLITDHGSLDISDVTLDGRFDLAATPQLGKEATVCCDAVNAVIRTERVKFVGGRSFDLRVRAVSGRSRLISLDTEFSGGCESIENPDGRCDCVRLHDAVDAEFYRPRCIGPADSKFGRSGIVHQMWAPDESTDKRGSLKVLDGYFGGIGYNSKHSYGAIDAYSGVDHVTIQRNAIERPWARGICVKADASMVDVSHNTVTGLHGEHAAASIAFYGSKLQRVGFARQIVSNTIVQRVPGRPAMIIDLTNIDEPSSAFAEPPEVRGNWIKSDGPGVLVKGGRVDMDGNRILAKYPISNADEVAD